MIAVQYAENSRALTDLAARGWCRHRVSSGVDLALCHAAFTSRRYLIAGRPARRPWHSASRPGRDGGDAAATATAGKKRRRRRVRIVAVIVVLTRVTAQHTCRHRSRSPTQPAARRAEPAPQHCPPGLAVIRRRQLLLLCYCSDDDNSSSSSSSGSKKLKQEFPRYSTEGAVFSTTERTKFICQWTEWTQWLVTSRGRSPSKLTTKK